MVEVQKLETLFYRWFDLFAAINLLQILSPFLSISP